MSAPVLTARGLRKAFGPQVLLDDVSLSIHDGERLGLVGINGSGKSTLARVLAGVEPLDEGEVATRRDAHVMYLEQEPSFATGTTAREVVTSGLSAWNAARRRHEEASAALAAGDGKVDRLLEQQAAASAEVERLGGWDADHRVDAYMTRLGVPDAEAPMDRMSGGERRRVALARILVGRPDLAILDEPTNHLDIDSIEWLERYLIEEHTGALLLITHDRYVLDRVVTRTVELDRGGVYSYEGGWEDYLEAKAERLAHEARTEANRQNFLRRELDWLRRSPKARTGKQKARIKRAQQAVGAKPEARREQVGELRMSGGRLGRTVLELRGLEVELGGRRLVDGLDLTVTKGERIGVIGPNGAGKTSLLRVLMGTLEPSEGDVEVGKNTRFAYLDQARGGLEDDRSILDNVAGDRRKVTIGDREVDVRGWLEGFLFDGAKQRQMVGALSGGERARVALARMLLEPANVLLLDEPTNDLDVATLGALESMLLDLSGTALVVTHDRYFLDRVATAILAFEGDGRVVRYAGNYESYRAQRPERAGPEAPSEPVDEPKPRRSEPASDPARKKGLTYGERLELDELMERIDTAESDVAAREAELSDPDLYATRGEEVPELNAALERAQAELAELMARWEELESRR